jgi:poly(glycerol-phosphate) alpha-glucosyltransferase
MKLAILLPFITSEGGGVTEAVRVLVTALARHKTYEIHIICFEGADQAEALKAWPDVQVHSFNTYGPKSYRFSPAMAAHMLLHQYDLVHLHGIWTSHVLAARIAQLRHTPVIISPHGMLEAWILKRRARLKQVVSWLYQNRTLRKASTLHALTEKERAEIATLFPKTSIKIIPNFILPLPKSQSRPNWWDPTLEGKKVFLFLARIHDKKGWRELLAGWRALMMRRPELRSRTELVFCGWLDNVPSFEDEIERAREEIGNLRYGGSQYGANKTATLKASDFFVLPSFSEGLPMSVLEAVESNALIAMSAECNLPQMFKENGAIETGTTPETISKALEICADLDEDAAQDIRKNAKAFVAQTMSEKAIIEDFSELYMTTANTISADLRITDESHSIFTGAASFSLPNRLTRAVWEIVWLLLARWTPPPLHKWRILLLRLFGARVDWSCKVYSSASIWLPAHLHMAPQSVMGPRVQCYNQAPISIETRAIVSQGAHLCSGTHDFNSPGFQLKTYPIMVNAEAWICADAFIGPGVTVGEGAILGARGVTFKDLSPWTISGGNPARCIKERHRQ